MDRVIHIRADNDENTSNFSVILKMLCREGRSSEPGWRAARSELLKLLFIQILRFNMAEHQRQDRTCQSNHPFALMFDRKLRGVTEALYHSPERPWTVADMAAEAGMSRTKFSLRFAQVAGMAPLEYLTNHRMMKAAELLERTDATLEEIAEQIGYGSEAAFSTAFKREMGMAPGGYRRMRNKNRLGGTSEPRTSDIVSPMLPGI
jgi:AraC-like DNA-binding protein